MAGYSGKSLGDKLGIRAGHRVALLHAPDDFSTTLAPVPEAVAFTTAAEDVDVALLFVRWRADLEQEFAPTAAALRDKGMLWIGWPKKASRQPTDVSEDVVREVGLAAGLVDVKVCAIDDVWSGLKFVRRARPRR